MRITVFCGSSRSCREPYLRAAARLGAEIARRGHVLIFGGGCTGLMGALADAALAARGEVHGVILREFIEREVHHAEVLSMVSVEDMRSRKAGLDERADAFVALPGGLGTLEEITEILSLRKLGHHHRRVVFLNVDGYFDPLLEQIDRAIEEAFEPAANRAIFDVTDDPVRAVDLCEAVAEEQSAAAS